MKKNLLAVVLLLASHVIFKNISTHEIRLYQESDYTCLKSMIADNQDLLFPGDTLEEQIEKTAKFFGSKNYTTQVCVKDDKLVGFITYQKELPHWFLGWLTRYTGVIQLLNVLKEYRGQGIGQTLLTTTLTNMQQKGFKKVTLVTKVANIAACTLYKKHGFKLAFQVLPGVSDCFYTCNLSDSKL